MATTTKLQGVVKRMNHDFGFITHTATGEDYFFHWTLLAAANAGQQRTLFGQLQEGDRVEFTPADGPKGPRALDVTISR